MDGDEQDLRPYTLRVEGSVVPLRDREFVNTVLARSPETEEEIALVLATPDQVAKLHDFLRVHDVMPATDGIYVGHTGTWFVLKHGEVTESGQWTIPRGVIASLLDAGASTTAGEPMPDAAEHDPVCGIAIKPGHEATSITYQGQTYHFCSAECRAIFLESPGKYANSQVSSGMASSN